MIGAICPPEHWPLVSTLLDEVLDAPPDQRASVLARIAAAHPVVFPVVERIASNQLSTDTRFLESAAIQDAPPEPHREEDRLGPWQLVAQIGEGGMGEVWRAQRIDGAYQRTVALKLPHRHYLAGSVQRRFDRERDVLARLNHPGIAQFLDAGLALHGQPYIAMEFIAGLPITDYCSEHHCSVLERIRLIEQIAASVAYAHAQAVVHRDIKPSNVLVTPAGETKLLDFGIAKLLDNTSDPDMLDWTRVGAAPATPSYAAPEQMRGEPATTAVDIYSLGALLFHVLTGKRPHFQPLASRRPSLHLAPDHYRRCGVANSKVLAATLRGNVDAVVEKALSPDRVDRYATVVDFARDLRALCEHRPVYARPLGRVALVTNVIRRHKLAAALIALTFVSLMTAAGVVALSVIRQADAATQVLRQAEIALASERFITGLFGAVGPSGAAGTPNSLEQLARLGVTRARKDLGEQPAVFLNVMRTLGHLLLDLDRVQDAVDALRAVHETSKGTFSADHPTRLGDALSLADAMLKLPQNSFLEAEQIAGEVARQTAQLVNQRALHARARLVYGRALVLQSHRGDALLELQGAVNLFSEFAPAHSEDLAESLLALGALQVRYPQTMSIGLESLSRAQQVFQETVGGRHPKTLRAKRELGVALASKRDWPPCHRLRRELVEVGKHVYGEGHPTHAKDVSDLAEATLEMGDYGEAEKLLRQAASWQSADPLQSEGYASSLRRLARLQARQYDYDSAARNMAKSTEIVERLFSLRRPLVLLRHHDTARLLLEAGRPKDAESRILPAIQWQHEARWYDGLLRSHTTLAAIQRQQGRLQLARASIETALTFAASTLASFKTSDLPLAFAEFGRILRDSGEYALALDKVREAKRLSVEGSMPAASIAEIDFLEAQILAATGQCRIALPQLRAARDARSDLKPATQWVRGRQAEARWWEKHCAPTGATCSKSSEDRYLDPDLRTLVGSPSADRFTTAIFCARRSLARP